MTTTIMATLAQQIDAEHEAATAAAVSALDHARQCGELLIEAKAQCDHGQWIPWLESNCKVSPRQSQRYMTVARNWTAIESKYDAASFLTIDGAIKSLASPNGESVPTEQNPYFPPIPDCPAVVPGAGVAGFKPFLDWLHDYDVPGYLQWRGNSLLEVDRRERRNLLQFVTECNYLNQSQRDAVIEAFDRKDVGFFEDLVAALEV